MKYFILAGMALAFAAAPAAAQAPPQTPHRRRR
jgi:hypothetical protein